MSLINAMIKQSDNTASNALDLAFRLRRDQCDDGPRGDDEHALRRHFLDWSAIVAHNENISTARDMAALLYEIERGSREGLDTIAKSDSCRQDDSDHARARRSRQNPGRLTTRNAIANKTGEITGVRSDVAIVEPFGETPYILVVMTKELRDYSAGISAIRRVAHDVNRTINAKYGLT